MKRFVVMVCAVLLVAAVANAAPLTVSRSTGSLAASVTFVASGSNLIVTLTNTSTYDVLNPSMILTAVFFNAPGLPSLTPVSATLAAGSTVFYGPNGGGNVGGEWAYANTALPFGTSYGISSAGFNYFGAGNFNGPNLEGPVSVNGMNYGIVSAGDNLTIGNAAVTGGNPLIKNSVVFTLSGLPGGFDPSAVFRDVVFVYGTSIGENQLVPEPASVLLLGTGLVGVAALLRRRKR